MPQPISTPTAAGTMAPVVGITEPTVAPLPRCTSGMAATCAWTKGSAATLASCWSASGCASSVHTCTGTRVQSMVCRMVMVVASSLRG